MQQCVKEGTKTFVFDAEAVAIDKDTAKLLPFQELSRRKRKDVKVEDIKVRVCLFAFDLLYLNGEVRGDPSSVPGLACWLPSVAHCTSISDALATRTSTRFAHSLLPLPESRSS